MSRGEILEKSVERIADRVSKKAKLKDNYEDVIYQTEWFENINTTIKKKFDKEVKLFEKELQKNLRYNQHFSIKTIKEEDKINGKYQLVISLVMK